MAEVKIEPILSLPADMNWQDDQTIYDAIIAPLLGTFPEIRWFADTKVKVTHEASGGSKITGWTHKLAEAKEITPLPNGKKYIELERMLSSVIMFMQFLDGSDAAYQKITSVQTGGAKLTRESFKTIHNMTKVLCEDVQKFNQLVAMLVYSDAGKTPEARRRAKEFGITAYDHDDWADEVLELKSDAMTKIFPSLAQLTCCDPNFIKQLKRTHAGMKIHLGHVLHLEGGQKMFSKLLTGIQAGNVTQETLDIILIINLADAAAAVTHVNPRGSLALTEATFVGYQCVKKGLEVLEKTQSPEKALAAYTRERAKMLGFLKEEEKMTDRIFLLTRFAAQTRQYFAADGAAIQQTAGEMLTEQDYAALQSIFGETQGINVWTRNPTYVPAVLMNLSKKGGVKAALDGFVCIARLLKHLSQQNPDIVTSNEPLCFNPMAKLAAEKPELFNKETFDPRNFVLNGKQEIIHWPIVRVVYADKMFFRKCYKVTANTSSVLQATSRKFRDKKNSMAQ